MTCTLFMKPPPVRSFLSHKHYTPLLLLLPPFFSSPSFHVMSDEVLFSLSRCFLIHPKPVSVHRGAVTDHFCSHVIYRTRPVKISWEWQSDWVCQPSELAVMCRAVTNQRGLESWMCALGQRSVQACKIMTDHHGNPRPLPPVINARVGPHVRH